MEAPVTTVKGLDLEAIKQAILRELARQNVEFGGVSTVENTKHELIIYAHVYREDQIQERYIEKARVSNQLII